MLESKIKSLAALKKITTRLKKQGKVIVFTNGCFDLMHYGHTKYLAEAKKFGDKLIVAVNSDASVKQIKGFFRPVIRQADRIKLIAALECVDYTLLFSAQTPLAVIKTLKPDVLVKGADWKRQAIVGGDFVRSYGGKVKTIKLVKGRSTTNLINKIAKISAS